MKIKYLEVGGCMSKIDNYAEEWMKTFEQKVEPIWKRVGFPRIPDAQTSGKGIGIIILDDIISHKLVHHLGDRLKQVTVDDNFTVTCKTVTPQHPQHQTSEATEHGLMVLQLLAHLPFCLHDKLHTGLAPAATFIILSEMEPEKIERGLDWILQERTEWNIQLLLNLIVPDTREIGSMKSTSKDRFVKAMSPAVESDVFIVAANGNTKIHNNLHPAHFFAVSGYDDQGVADCQKHKPHPTVPWGRNGDGHMRPDILAPFTYLPVPYCEQTKSDRLLSYFGGSCGAAALVTGVCAHFLSKFPDLSHAQLKRVLIEQGSLFENNEVPIPKMDVTNMMKVISADYRTEVQRANHRPSSSVNEGTMSITSEDPVVRARVLTDFIEKEQISRESLWNYLTDSSPVVRKTVISYGLGIPKDEKERSVYWNHFYNSEQKTGEKISWLHQLLISSTSDELDYWMDLIKEKELENILCVKTYLEKYYPEAPWTAHTPDPDPDFIAEITEPVLRWYKEYRKKTESFSP